MMVCVKEMVDWSFDISMSEDEWDILNRVLQREKTTLDELLRNFILWLVYDTDEAVKWIKENMDSQDDIVDERTETSKRADTILKVRRAELGITQQAIADKAMIQLQQYQKFEAGERDITNASFDIACRVLMALDIDIEGFHQSTRKKSEQQHI